MRYTKQIIGALILLCTFAAGVLTARRTTPTERIHTRDTIVITRLETVRIERPTERLRTVIRHDTVWLARADEIRDKEEGYAAVSTDTDSARVALPITTTVYGDSTYRAVVSGYKARLDTLVWLRPRSEKLITSTIRHTPKVAITIGPQAGFYRTPLGWQPGIGIGISAGITIRFGD